MLDFISLALYTIILIDNIYQHRINRRLEMQLEMLMKSNVVEVSDPEMLEQILSDLIEKGKDEKGTNT